MKHFIPILALLACVTVPRVPPTPLVAFNPDEAKWAEGTGTAIIEGQAFLKTRGGDVKYGAGNNVYLVPNTPHSFDWFTRITGGQGANAPTVDPRLEPLVKRTMSSGDGRFKFENVPSGPYLVVTTVTWQTATGYRGAAEMQGGWIGAPVVAENGKTVSAIITR